MSATPNNDTACTLSNCRCNSGGGINRRDFLTGVGAGSLAILASKLPVMAGPFTASDFEKLVPADKKLDPNWIKSLYDRGEPTVYRGADLKYIGMPVGGIAAGQLYLGGDGKLWHWDIFNQHIGTGDGHYARPPAPDVPLEQSFFIKIGDESRTLDAKGFAGVSFTGQYPIGTVNYADPNCPLTVTLEAFSPFIPLNVEDSSLPATVLRFTLHNTSPNAVEAALSGKLENAVCLHHRSAHATRSNKRVDGDGLTFLECSVEKSREPVAPTQPDIVFEDWNKEKYDGWNVEGAAFGDGPIVKSAIPEYQGDVGGDTDRVVNSHASAPGKDVGARDNATGKLTSKPFKIERNFIHFWIGGGNFKGKTCLNLIVDGKVAKTVAGENSNRMKLKSFDVRNLMGKEAAIEIVDAQPGPWGNVGVGKITFADHEGVPKSLEQLEDFGTMGLALLGAAAEVFVGAGTAPLSDKLIGEVGRRIKLNPGQSATVVFVLAWHFSNLQVADLPFAVGRHYAARFDSAAAVARHVAKEYERLYSQTRLWRDTWYDSSLPHWFLDRTLLNASILATSTTYRFASGRFYGWEGVGCCAGTCTHVWHYEHAMGRLFPELDILLREKCDFVLGAGFHADGMIGHRGELAGAAVDGQAGTLLRAYRDHQMSPDDAFLKRNWPSIRKGVEWLIRQDANADGILEGPQHNTLDAEWFGAVPWLSGLYLAALRAGEEMARAMGDDAFAGQCRAILDVGPTNLIKRTFNGEYFIQVADPARKHTVGSYDGCEIDQVFGQHWAWQVGLGRVLPAEQTKQALAAIWKYNFTPDVGPFRASHKPGRWYAMAGEAGTLMCSWPRGETLRIPTGYDYYFNECMNGFEHQVAGHMIWEGMVQEGLAIERAVHDRYHASKRNPWNEVECGDHYARSMASYGVFTAACGYEYHGPRGHLAFAPRLTPENFKAAFTAAEGWGSFSQKQQGASLATTLEIKWGRLRLKTLGLVLPSAVKPAGTKVTGGGKDLEHTIQVNEGRVVITFAQDAVVEAGQKLEAVVGEAA